LLTLEIGAPPGDGEARQLFARQREDRHPHPQAPRGWSSFSSDLGVAGGYVRSP